MPIPKVPAQHLKIPLFPSLSPPPPHTYHEKCIKHEDTFKNKRRHSVRQSSPTTLSCWPPGAVMACVCNRMEVHSVKTVYFHQQPLASLSLYRLVNDRQDLDGKDSPYISRKKPSTRTGNGVSEENIKIFYDLLHYLSL